MRVSRTAVGRAAEGSSELAWEIIVVDDASPDGTQEVAIELARVYGEDKIVSVCLVRVVTMLNAPQVLKPRPGKLGLGCVCRFPLILRGLVTGAQDCIYPWTGLLYWRLCYHYGR